MSVSPVPNSVPPTSRSFEEFYRQHVAEVYAYAVARVGREDAEDITAEVFHAAAKVVREEGMIELKPAWLMTVARNKVIDQWRKRERREQKLHLLTFDDESPDPSEAILSTEQREKVLAALDRVSNRHRLLLMTHYVDGMSASAIAGASDMSVAAVESALARARRSFRHQFDKLEEQR